MSTRRKDGLFWPSFFSISNNKAEDFLKSLQNQMLPYEGNLLSKQMIDENMFDHNDELVQSACEHVALKFMLCDTTLARDLLSEDEFCKAKEVFARKQYNSKLLQKLLHFFLNLLLKLPSTDSFKFLFAISINDEKNLLDDEKTNKSYGELKKIVEKATAGVKSICYFEAEEQFSIFNIPLVEQLNDSFSQIMGYDFNKFNFAPLTSESSTLFCTQERKTNNHILQLALFDNESFWEKHQSFNVVKFLNEVYKSNDIRHAEKLLHCIAENLRKMPNMNLVLENGFSLYTSLYSELVECLEDQAFRFSFTRLQPYCDTSKIKGVRLCHPMSHVDSKFFDVGKELWDAFICEYNYPNDYKEVQQFLNDEIERFVSGTTHQHDDIAVILDAAPFRYSADSEDRKIFKAYHPDCFISDSIWKRVYLKAYAITQLTDDKQTQLSYLQKIFVDLIKSIEKRIGVCTAHQLNYEQRDNSYKALKGLLSSFGVTVNDKYKSNYIASLLDTNTALLEEEELFRSLEQTGDAIYGLAAAELLFYNPKTKHMANRLENLCRAEAQIAISKKFGFDKLFLQIGLPTKHLDCDSVFYNFESLDLDKESILNLSQEKYLADSLEMIIASIYYDAGIEQALGFAKTIIRDTFNLENEIRFTNENLNNRNIENSYWTKIRSAPYSIMTGEHNTLWGALNKAILCLSIGTDTKEKRIFITNNFGNTAIYNDAEGAVVCLPLYHYLHEGLSSVLEKYSEMVRNNYKNK